MIIKFKEILMKLCYRMSKEYCYDKMEYEGVASMGLCSGVVGNDKTTDNLSLMCVDCKYLSPNKIKGSE